MTRAEAKYTYEMCYHKQVLKLIETLQKKAESYEEKTAIWDYWFKQYKSPKKRFDILIKG